MIITRDLKHCRQDRADLDATITEIRAEGRELMDIAATARTPAQIARLDALEKQLTPLTRQAATLAAEMAQLEREQAEMIATATGGKPKSGPARGRRYADMFPGVRLDAGGFTNSNEFLGAMHS